MYEAPDRFKRMKAARLPDGESLGLTSEQADTTNSPLKDVQLISRAQLAPFFTAANICAAVMAAFFAHCTSHQICGRSQSTALAA